MFRKTALPSDFRPDYMNTFSFLGSQFVIWVQYLGPFPERNRPNEPEVFLFAIYENRVLIESGTLDWDPRNGPMAYSTIGIAVLMFCSGDPQ
jgi:hypothetical protein